MMYLIVAIFAAAFFLPGLLFLWFHARSGRGRAKSALLAFAAGWALNVAVVFALEAIEAGSIGGDPDNRTVVVLFGWVCPLIVVSATWLIFHLLGRRRGRTTTETG